MTKSQIAKNLLNERLQKLISDLRNLAVNSSHAADDHTEADRLLLEYINEPKVLYWFNHVDKWYE